MTDIRQRGPDCPDEDVPRRYALGALSDAEAESFEQHMFACENCWAEVEQAIELRAALRDRPASRSRARPPVWSWMAAAAVLVVALVGVWGLRPGVDVPERDGPRVYRGAEGVLAIEARVEGRRLALSWTAVPGAASYVVEVFAGGSLVLEKEAAVPELTLDLPAGELVPAVRVRALDDLRQEIVSSQFIELDGRPRVP